MAEVCIAGDGCCLAELAAKILFIFLVHMSDKILKLNGPTKQYAKFHGIFWCIGGIPVGAVVSRKEPCRRVTIGQGRIWDSVSGDWKDEKSLLHKK